VFAINEGPGGCFLVFLLCETREKARKKGKRVVSSPVAGASKLLVVVVIGAVVGMYRGRGEDVRFVERRKGEGDAERNADGILGDEADERRTRGRRLSTVSGTRKGRDRWRRRRRRSLRGTDRERGALDVPVRGGVRRGEREDEPWLPSEQSCQRRR
jgi:hypothetical protein